MDRHIVMNVVLESLVVTEVRAQTVRLGILQILGDASRVTRDIVLTDLVRLTVRHVDLENTKSIAYANTVQVESIVFMVRLVAGYVRLDIPVSMILLIYQINVSSVKLGNMKKMVHVHTVKLGCTTIRLDKPAASSAPKVRLVIRVLLYMVVIVLVYK